MSEQEKVKFYKTTWFMWVMLIFFAPVGIFLLWKNERISKTVKIVISVVFAIWFLIVITSSASEESVAEPTEETAQNETIEENMQETEPKTEQDTQKTEQTQEETTNGIEVPEGVDEETFNEVKQLDAEMWQVVLDVEKANNELIAATETDDAVALYTKANNTKAYQQECFSRASDVNIKNKNKNIDMTDYRNAVQVYASECKSISEDVMKILESEDIKAQSSLATSLQNLSNYVIRVTGARYQFLLDSGLSVEQVELITGTEE